jgi:hypothetical protein
MRAGRWVLQLFATVFDRIDIAALCIDGKDKGIARACIDSDEVAILGCTKSYIRVLVRM